VPGGDSITHFVGSGLLAFIMVLGFSSLGTNHRTFGPIAILVSATLLVTLGEVIQLAMPNRDFQLNDLAWSFAGSLVFGIAATGLERIRRRLGQSSATFR
jgi:VanZ family protein